jgi:hypothetical protein
MILTTHNDEFGAVLLESMDGAIRSLLSQEVAEAFHANLRDKHSINPEDMLSHLATVSIVLEKYFGPSARTIEKAIAQRLYSKYDLEFQGGEGYKLTDYVNNAKNKLPKSPALSSEPANVNLPLTEDFNRLLVESVKEAIEDAVGKDSAKLAFRLIERDVTFDELPRHLPTFYLALRNNFGKDHRAIETAIAKTLYLKLSLEFIETPNTELGKYVELAFIKVRQREQAGFKNLTEKKGGLV